MPVHDYFERPPSTTARVALLGVLSVVAAAMIWAVDHRAVQVEAAEVAPAEPVRTYQQIVAVGTDEQILALLDELGTRDPTSLSQAWIDAFDPANIDRERSIRLLRQKFASNRDRVVRGKIAALVGEIGGEQANETLIWITRVTEDVDVLANAIAAIGRQEPTRELMRALTPFYDDGQMPQYVYLSARLFTLRDAAWEIFRRFRTELDIPRNDEDWRWP